MKSVLIGAHDGKHARRLLGVRRVSGAELHGEVVVVYLSEIRLALDLEVAEVVLAVRVIVLREIAEGLNRQEHARFGIDRQGIDARRHDDLTADEGAAEVVIEGADNSRVVDVFGAHTNATSTKAETELPPLMSLLARAGD